MNWKLGPKGCRGDRHQDPVDAGVLEDMLAGEVPGGSGRRPGLEGQDRGIARRPGRDLAVSAPKPVFLAALIGGGVRVVAARDAPSPGSRPT